MELIKNLKIMFGLIDEDDVITRERIDKNIDDAFSLCVTNNENLELLMDSLESDSGGEYLEYIRYVFKHSGLKDTFYSIGLDESTFLKNLIVIRKIAHEVENGIGEIRGRVKDSEFDRLVKAGASEKQLLTIKIMTDLSNMVALIKDILILSVYLILEDELYYKTKSIDIVEAIKDRKELFKYFNKNSVSKMISYIDKVSDEPGEVGSPTLNRSPNAALKTKFTGNIIYHIGTLWGSYRHEVYEANVQQAILTSLKIRKLRSKINDGDSSSLNKQIEYHEDKLKKLEQAIKEYEEDV